MFELFRPGGVVLADGTVFDVDVFSSDVQVGHRTVFDSELVQLPGARGDSEYLNALVLAIQRARQTWLDHVPAAIQIALEYSHNDSR